MRAFRDTTYLLTSLFTGVWWFTVVVTGLAVGLGLAVTLVGIPILVGTFVVSDVAAELERKRARALLGVALPTPPPRTPTASGFWARFRNRAGDPLMWRGVLFHFLGLPVGIITFTLAITTWALGLVLLSVPAVWWPTGIDLFWDGNAADTPLELIGLPLLGIVVLVLAPWVMRGLAVAAGGLASVLLGATRADLEDRARRAEAAQLRSVDQAAAERRQIERDLHDGAQARLVSVAMELGRARARIESGASVDAVAPIVLAAHDDAKLALVELRDLARGIHPAVLTDRGLDAALSSLAAGSPLEVEIRADISPRPDAATEATAYFVVAECLTNAARHAGAGQVRVEAVRSGANLRIEVCDDGRGGAVERPHSGLAGLRERVESGGGTLGVESPPGGPTTIAATLVCRDGAAAGQTVELER